MRSKLLFILSFFLSVNLFSQESPLTNVIRGKVFDQLTQSLLQGATIQLNDTLATATSSAQGQFRLEKINPGRYTLQVKFIGYEPFILSELLVETGKEIILEIALQPAPYNLDELTVSVPRAKNKTTIPGLQTITVEEVFRFPATFFDPARLATLFPGVSGDNDQANGISIRGNSPNMVSWQLEGVEIINPNHTPNAGTGTDRVTQNGGGVNMISAQMLANTSFLTGAFPAGYGNVLSGVMDLSFRPGNNEKNEFIVQAGLIGIDLAAEGPLAKNKKSSFLVNYRYSTIGLLSAMGLDLGDESISFQDLSFHLNFPTKNNGKFSVFGVRGTSKNIFEAERDPTTWEFSKDGSDIFFESQSLATGISVLQPVGTRSTFKSTLVYSASLTERTEDILSDNFAVLSSFKNINDQQKLGWRTEFNTQLNQSFWLKSGLVMNRIQFNGGADTPREASGVLTSPFLSLEGKLSPKFSFQTGLHLQSFSLSSDLFVEPRISMAWNLKETSTIQLAYGLHSQTQPGVLYFSTQSEIPSMSRAHHLILGWNKQLNTKNEITVNAFYQSLFNIPVAKTLTNSFSAINILEEIPDFELDNTGTGMNRGVEMSFRRFMSKDFYLMTNLSLYQATYKGSDGVERDSRYNGRYTYNLTTGKEWRKRKRQDLERVIGLNLRGVITGGFRATPIDVAQSLANGTTIYFTERAFEEQLPGYFRTDLRWYVKRNKPGKVSTLAIDVQNLTNHQNIAFSYFDTRKGEIVNKYQLGIIPLLSWRLEF
ncbi:MAG: hypothetical protein RJA52_762 [Bacteroidota bacterium]